MDYYVGIMETGDKDMHRSDKKVFYVCSICGWVGTEPKELAGSLWDYEMHDSCPICWEDDAIDNLVDIISVNFDYDKET